MSIRMGKQTLRKEIGAEKKWVPGPGEYSFETKRDIGNEPRRLQQWKTPLRRTSWHHRPTDAADVMYSSLMDLNSINSSVVKGERRYTTTMRKCLPRSPAENDSRREKEKLKFKVFEVMAPVSTDPELGPGRYPHERPSDIGNDRRRLQTWTTPIRTPTWWRRATDAPDGDALLNSSPFDRPSTNRCGGSLQQCWPQPEDEQGRPMTTGIFAATSPLGTLSPARRKGRPPATA